MSIVARVEQLSDEVWALIEPLLPSSAGGRGGVSRASSHRAARAGIEAGRTWRGLSTRAGSDRVEQDVETLHVQVLLDAGDAAGAEDDDHRGVEVQGGAVG